MPETYSDEDARRVLLELSMRFMQRLSHNTPSILDCPFAAGIARVEVQRIRDAHLQRSTQAHKSGKWLSPGPEMVKEIKERFPIEDPFLLLWRIRLEEYEGALASSGLLGSAHNPRPERATNSYRALAPRLYKDIAESVARKISELCDEVYAQGRPITRDDVQATWDRVDSIGEIRPKDRSQRRTTARRAVMHFDRRPEVPHG